MKIISWNVNGLRAVEKKGELQTLLSTHKPDILLLQETKMQNADSDTFVKKYAEYIQAYHQAEKKGYSGVSTWIRKSLFEERKMPLAQVKGMPQFLDTEGRILSLHWGDISFVNAYFPNGGKSKEAWEGKLVFYKKFLEYVNSLRKADRKILWGGDVNCAHEEIDIARPKENEKSIGFLPEERSWVSEVIQQKWVDIFRKKHPKTVVYSWWHLLTKARERNIGWRIDYLFTDENLLPKVKKITYLNEQMGSDHCPVLLDMDV